MLAILAHTSFRSFEESQEDAVNHILKYVQSRDEARNVFKSITLDDSILETSKEGKEKLDKLLDWAEQRTFDIWHDNLAFKPVSLGKKVTSVATLDFNSYNNIRYV